MGNDRDDDVVQLPSAWTMEARRARREIQLQAIWDAHAKPYSSALGSGGLQFADHVKRGDWTMENWVVENLFLEGHIGLLVGDAGTGKSLAALDMMIAAASGGRWLGHFEVMTTPVVYLAGEGKIDENTSHAMGLILGRGDDHGEFMKRYQHRVHLIAPENLGLTPDAPLSSDSWWHNIEALVKSTYPKEARPRLWILDPLLALINSTDKADDVRPFVARVRWLAEQTGGYCLVIHHPNKSKGVQVSRRDKVRGESMLVNLFDDVLIMENDSEDSKLVHLYANKLKRGAADDTKPLCHIARTFTAVSQHTFDDVLRKCGVRRTGEESPRSLKQITMRYIAYSPELHRKEDDSGEVDGPRKREPQEASAASSEQKPKIDMTAWDTDQQKVWNVLTMIEEPLTVTGMQRVLLEKLGYEVTTTRIQTRLDALEGLGLIGHVPTKPTTGRPGTGYALKSRLENAEK